MGTQDAYTKTDQLLITAFFRLETFTRHLLMAIIPLDLLNHLGNTQRVTLFYAVVAIFGLGNSIPAAVSVATPGHPADRHRRRCFRHSRHRHARQRKSFRDSIRLVRSRSLSRVH
jgi:hypothetical protein